MHVIWRLLGLKVHTRINMFSHIRETQTHEAVQMSIT